MAPVAGFLLLACARVALSARHYHPEPGYAIAVGHVGHASSMLAVGSEKVPALSNYSGEPYVHITVREKNSESMAEEWQRLNPDWTVLKWSNLAQEEICERDLKNYSSLKPLLFPVERADIARLLALYDYGGVYSDADVRPQVPIDEWLPHFGYSKPVHLLMGDEFPRPETGNPFQLENWAFAAVPGNPVVARAINMLPDRINNLPHDLEHVTRRTGPALVTSAAIDFLSEHGQQLPTRGELNEGGGKLYELSNVTGWHGPLRVLILPYRAFGFCPQHDSREMYMGIHEDHMVEHQFDGSWKSDMSSLALAQQQARRAELIWSEYRREHPAPVRLPRLGASFAPRA